MTALAPHQLHKVAAARLWAASKHPYLASALFAAEVRADERVPGVAADRNWRLYVHPSVIESWSAAQLGIVLVHHCGHLLRDHADRAAAEQIDEQSFEDWVTATDCEINDDLALGDTELGAPVPFIEPRDIGCEPGRLAEEYYGAVRKLRVDKPEPGD